MRGWAGRGTHSNAAAHTFRGTHFAMGAGRRGRVPTARATLRGARRIRARNRGPRSTATIGSPLRGGEPPWRAAPGGGAPAGRVLPGGSCAAAPSTAGRPASRARVFHRVAMIVGSRGPRSTDHAYEGFPAPRSVARCGGWARRGFHSNAAAHTFRHTPFSWVAGRPRPSMPSAPEAPQQRKKTRRQGLPGTGSVSSYYLRAASALTRQPRAVFPPCSSRATS